MARSHEWTETLVDWVSGRVNQTRFNNLWLGGGAGPEGGTTYRPIEGQLTQRHICYDTSEPALPCSPSGFSSLMDNLRRMRYWQEPATWFGVETTSGLKVTIKPGLWYPSTTEYCSFAGGDSPTFTLPGTLDRVDTVYIDASGVLHIQQGTPAAVPTITLPDIASGIPLWAVYLTPTALNIYHPSCSGYYAGQGYIERDLRPFLNLGGTTASGISGFTPGSVIFAGADGCLTEDNDKLYFEDGNLAVGDNSTMRNVIQAVKEESTTNVDNIKSLITSRNINHTNNNWAGFSWQTEDVNGDIFSGARIMTQFTSHAAAAVSADMVFDTRNAGTRAERMRLLSDGDLGLGTPTVPHGGVGAAKFAIDGIDVSADGPHVQFTTDNDDHPLLQVLANKHDAIAIVFDAYYDYASWKSSDAGSNCLLYKESDDFLIAYDSGVAQGGNITWNTGIIMDLATGNVGIGTTAPALLLTLGANMNNAFTPTPDLNARGVAIHGAGASAPELHMHRDDVTIGTGNTIGSILFSGSDGGYQVGAKIVVTSPGDWGVGDTPTEMQFWTSPDAGTLLQRVTIDKNGNVGIGTTGPKSPLEVATTTGGAGRIDVLRIAEGTDALDNVAGIAFSTRGDISDRYVKSAIFHKQVANGSWGRGDLVFAVDSNADAADVASTDEKVRITYDGKVGIGTTGPNELLHLKNTAGHAKMEVESTTDNASIFINAPANELAYIAFETLGTEDWEIVRPANQTYLEIKSSAVNQVMVFEKATGNVGIGITAPDKKLHVVDAQASALSYPLKVENWANLGNVGILFAAGTGSEIAGRGKGGLVYEYDVALGWNKGSFHILQNTAGNANNPTTADAVVTIKNNGNVGIGRTNPYGPLHGYGSYGGFIFFEATSIGAGEVTIIPNLAGDVVYMLSYNSVLHCIQDQHNTGSLETPGAGNIENTLYTGDGSGNVFKLRLYSSGKVTIYRSAGGTLGRVALWLTWL